MNANSQIDALKKSVPMWMAAETRLKGITKRGIEYDCLCPYHDDHTQSFQIYQEKDGVWLGHCQACGVTKNIFQLVQDIDKVDFKTAMKIVQNMTNDPKWEQKKAAADAVFQRALSQRQEIITIPIEAFKSYTDALLNPASAGFSWLKSRGISPETAEVFNLGFVQKPLPTIVPTNHPWYAAGWVLFPEVREGRIVSIKYRSVMGKRIQKTDTTQGWSGFAHRKDMMGSVLYNSEAISSLEDVFVVEGEPDCLVLAQAGFCSVSLPSAGFNPTPDMRSALMCSNARYLAGDTDEVGVDAMNKLYRELGGESLQSKTYLLQWPKPYKDANQYFLEACRGNVSVFQEKVAELMKEARDRRLPGIQDLKTITRNTTFKPPHDNPNRLSFPWPNIDKWVDILPGEVMYMFATETKMGKSTWLENILIHNVLQGKKVVNFSAELSPERYATIVTANLLRRNRDTLTAEDFQEAAKQIPEDSFYFGYKPGIKFKAVVKLLEDAKQVYGGDIFVVDPLHFILRGGTPGQENSEFASAMKDLVDFSIKWNVIMIVVGQARKSMGNSRGRMATGQDARGTAAMGEDAATTWILHRNRVGRRTDEDEEGEPVFEPLTRVKLDYSRNSDAKSTKLIFDGKTASFNLFTNQAAEDISAETGQQ